MEIRIGIQHSPREIVVESEDSADSVLEQLATAVADGTTVTLEDSKGRKVLVPGAKLAFAEASTEEPRRVGFLS